MIRGKLTVLGAAVVAAALLTAACSSNGATAAPIASSPSDAGASTPTPKPVSDLKPAADFHFPLYQDAEHVGGAAEVTMAGLAGHPVVVNFWAPLCPPCRAEMPALQSVHDAHEDEMLLLGLDVGVFLGLGTRQSALALLDELDISYPAGGATNSTAMNNYVVDALPSTIFFGGDGEVFQRFSGAIRKNQLESIVSVMLAES